MMGCLARIALFSCLFGGAAIAAPKSPANRLGYSGAMTITLGVKDFDAAVAWYQKVLGLRLALHLPDMNWAELIAPTPNVTIALSQVGEVVVGSTGLTLGVDDIEVARTRLETQGVVFDGPTHTIPGQVKLATFFDPSGNTITLFELLDNGK